LKRSLAPLKPKPVPNEYLTYLFASDMQGLDADLPNASALEDANALALAIVPEGKLDLLNVSRSHLLHLFADSGS